MQDIKKSIYKAVMKSQQKKKTRQKQTDEIVEDILDPDNIAEVDMSKIPEHEENVVNKSSKGLKKLKKFINKNKMK